MSIDSGSMDDFLAHFDKLARAWPSLQARAGIRTRPEDFVVDEQLGFEPDGTGEHVLLHVRKRGLNTDHVARMLARHAGVAKKSIGYAGLKDRNAVTSQYFSVHLPGNATGDEPDWQVLNDGQLEILSVARHGRKLRTGALTGNRFQLRLTDVQGDRTTLDERLQLIRDKGVPNYFMTQRFGHNGQNLVKAERMLLEGQRVRDRHLRGLYLSAARSWLFNRVVSARIEAGCWDRALPGDSMMLDHSRACFLVEEVDDPLSERLSASEIHPTGPLWGRGRERVAKAALELERRVLADWQPWCEGLEKAGVEMARRRVRVRVEDLAWYWSAEDQLELSFFLAPGCYATAVVRELCAISTIQQTPRSGPRAG